MAAVSAAAAVAVPVSAAPDVVCRVVTEKLRTMFDSSTEMRERLPGFLIGKGDDMVTRNDDPAEASIRMAVTSGTAGPPGIPARLRPVAPAVGAFAAWICPAAEADAFAHTERSRIFPG